MIRVLLVFFCMVPVFGWSYSIEEIRELKNMGFTTEQIVELQTSGAPVPGGSSAGIATSAVAPDIVERLAGLKANGQGLLVVCATKEWPARGPGHLAVRIKYPTGKWGGLGRASLLEYSMDGRVTAPVFVKADSDEDCDTDVIVTHQMPIIISRYLGEFAIGAGQYEFELERAFKMNENENARGSKTRRHKKFYGVPIKPGMVTILSYAWNENKTFGLDHVLPEQHREFIDNAARKYGEYLVEIKVQHNR